MLRTQRPAVLITGFGPFPGVEVNASADLAMDLSAAAARAFPDYHFRVENLPVVWGRAIEHLDDAFDRVRPILSLHFGVSDRALGLVIETRARNHCIDLPDADGCRPRGSRLVAGGRPERKTRLPATAIVRRLTAEGVPAQLSTDAGSYLCNAVMYHALTRARRVTPPILTGFIHIPVGLTPACRTAPAALGWDLAIRGGLTVIAVCHASLMRRRHRST